MTGSHSRPKIRGLAPGQPAEASAPETPGPVLEIEGKEASPKTFPKIFGTYVLEELLSRGGMAEIYRAQRTGPHSFRKTVVLKKILPGLARNDDFRRLF